MTMQKEIADKNKTEGGCPAALDKVIQALARSMAQQMVQTARQQGK